MNKRSGFNGIRLGYFTDTHFRFQNPEYRKDNFKESIISKLKDVSNIVEEYELDAVLHGGDMFDTPYVGEPTWVFFASQLMSLGVPIYAIAGNHDIEGHNLVTLPNTPIDFLRQLGIINLIVQNKETPIVIKKNGISVQITGTSFHGLMDKKQKEEDYVITKKVADFAVHMVHGNLLDKPIIELADYTLVEEIQHTLADLTLSGHYHMGFPLTKVSDKGFDQWFYNPGGIIRKTRKEMLRMPTFTVIEITEEGIQIKDIPLPSAQKTEDILDIERIEKKKNNEEELNTLINDIRSKAVITKKFSITDVLNDIGSQQSIPQNVKDEAMRFVTQARTALGRKK